MAGLLEMVCKFQVRYKLEIWELEVEESPMVHPWIWMSKGSRKERQNLW